MSMFSSLLGSMCLNMEEPKTQVFFACGLGRWKSCRFLNGKLLAEIGNLGTKSSVCMAELIDIFANIPIAQQSFLIVSVMDVSLARRG